jgi:hypothetical protein
MVGSVGLAEDVHILGLEDSLRSDLSAFRP